MSSPFDRLQSAVGGRYQLERELGRGGMAIVYLAEDLKHHRKVAVKILQPELAQAVGPERFLQEIRIASHLTHPHILPLHDSGQADGLLFYVMPYIDGESLRDRLNREKQLPIDQALDIARDVAEALSHAHRMGVIHRDIKPENILLSAGHAVVSDFGIAWAVSEAGSERLTASGLALGTPAYMSPEQAAGDSDLDARTDIYGLGCVLYEMLTGQPPFLGSSAAAVLARKMVDPVPPLRTVRETVPQAIEDAVMRALARVPADRFAAVEEFANALRLPGPSLQGLPVTGIVRSRVAIAALAASAVIAVVVTAWVLGDREASFVPERVAVGLFENRTGDPSLDPLGSMAADWLTDGIQRLGFVEAVPTATAMFVASATSSTRVDSARPRDDLRRLAEETGAGTLVAGTYYRRGDSLQFQARIVDARRKKLLRAIDPVSGLTARPLDVIEVLRQKVVGALAVQFDTTVAAAGLVSSPPTFAAYKAYLDGIRLFSQLRIAEALPHLDSAVALDSTFMPALFAKASAHADLGQFVKFDSIGRLLESRRQRLTPAEQYDLDWMLATRRGDLARAFTALREKKTLTPDPATRYGAAVFALRVNRPTEALEDLTPRDRRSLFWRTWSWAWQVPTEAHHLLGNHSDELREARQGRVQHPDLLATMHFEALALAALGRETALQTLLNQASSLAPGPIWSYGSVAKVVALELRAHGGPEAAHAMLQRTIEWYRGRLSADPEQVDLRYGLASCLYLVGRWDQAREIAERLVAEIPDSGAPWRGVGTASDFDFVGLLGVIAARKGDREEAGRMSQRLAALRTPFTIGHPTLWRARIATLLGDQERAVGLLRNAISEGLMPLDLAEGVGYAMWLHRDADLESLRGYPPFEDLLRARR